MLPSGQSVLYSPSCLFDFGLYHGLALTDVVWMEVMAASFEQGFLRSTLSLACPLSSVPLYKKPQRVAASSSGTENEKTQGAQQNAVVSRSTANLGTCRQEIHAYCDNPLRFWVVHYCTAFPFPHPFLKTIFFLPSLHHQKTFSRL